MTGGGERDGSPTDAEAASVIHARFPALGALAISQLGEGTDHRAFDVGGLHVFRFPRSDQAAARLAAEIRLTAWLSARLPLTIPTYRYVGRSTPAFPRPFAGYGRLPGTPALLCDLGPSDLAAIARRLGDFLRTLHGLDVAAGLGLSPDDDPTREEWSTHALADLRLCHRSGHIDAASAASWELLVGSPPLSQPPVGRIVHGDFAAEHVLIDEQAGPCAVIDWSDALLGDPAFDLAGLVHWGGERMLSAALTTYDAADDALLERARWFAACRGVADIAFGETHGRPEYIGAGQRALAGLAARRP